jgi:hypothetical protein
MEGLICCTNKETVDLMGRGAAREYGSRTTYNFTS